MDALKAVGLCALLSAPQNAAPPCGSVVEIPSPAIDRWQTFIEAAAKRFGIPAPWIRAVMARESAGLTTLNGVPIVSRAGAMGLMQLMPGTWSDMRARYQLGNDPFEPHDNIFAGTAYLREMFDRYGNPGLFVAYQAGPGRLDAVLAGLQPLPETTKTYVKSIAPDFKIEAISNGNRLSNSSKPASDSLFFVRSDREKSSSATSNPNALIVPLVTQQDFPAH